MVLYKFIVDETKCMDCGACMDLCPSTCIEFTRAEDTGFYGNLYNLADGVPEGQPMGWMMEKPFLPIQERCTGCQICVRECPTNAITVEADTGKPISARPRPVMIQLEGGKDDGYWHPLSEYTRDYLKRPVRSPWSKVADWRPMIGKRRVNQTWRNMEENK